MAPPRFRNPFRRRGDDLTPQARREREDSRYRRGETGGPPQDHGSVWERLVIMLSGSRGGPR